MNSKKVYNLYKNKDIKTKQIIDIRDNIKNREIKGSRHISMNKLLAHPERYLKKEEEYFIICESGVRSLRTTLSLKFKKYKVRDVSGGYNLWKTYEEKK